MPELILNLLGGFEARTDDNAALSFPTKKTKALLAYLAVRPGKSHARSDLATLLWGNSGDDQARASLRQTLSYLRKALAPTGRQHLVVRDDAVSIDPATIQVDVATLEDLSAQGIPEALEQVGALYHGDFLQGFDLRERDFNDWLAAERARLQELATALLRKLLAHHGASGRPADGIRIAHRLLAIDPLQEQVHRALMRLHLRQGERALALKQYETCRDVLRRELSVEPDDETKHLRQEACSTAVIEAGVKAEAQSAASPEKPPGVAESPALTVSHRPKRRRWMRRAAALAAIAVAIPLGAAWLDLRAPDVKPAAVERMAYPLPDRPSVAVLPFLNLSDDPDKDYFSDGITENIITDLSRFSGLFVIARNSAFAYKGKDVKIQQVAEDLGVQYVLEGSVQRLGDRLRITTKLADALTGKYVWAERYDREVSDLFAVQDDVVREMVSRLGGYRGEVAKAARKRAMRKPTENLGAYETFLIGAERKHRFKKQDNAVARDMFERAIELDPHFARAHVALAWTHLFEYWFGWADDPAQAMERAVAAAQEALYLDDSDAEAHWVMADIHRTRGEDEQAIAGLDRALALNPNNADVLMERGFTIVLSGAVEDGIAVMQKAMRLNPRHLEWYERVMGAAYYTARRYEDAVAALKKVKQPVRVSRGYLAASYAQLGRSAEAAVEVQEILKRDPDASVESITSLHSYKNAADGDHFRDGLRKAGLPD